MPKAKSAGAVRRSTHGSRKGNVGDDVRLKVTEVTDTTTVTTRRSQRLQRLRTAESESRISGADTKSSTVSGIDFKRTKPKKSQKDTAPKVTVAPQTSNISIDKYTPPSFDYAIAIEHISRAHDGHLAALTRKRKCDVFHSLPPTGIVNFDKADEGDYPHDGVDPAFQSLCRSIIFQQISGKAANTILERFIAAFRPGGAAASTGNSKADKDTASLDGDGKAASNDVTELWSAARKANFFPTPKMVCAATDEVLRTCGLSSRKVIYVKDLASKFASGDLSMDKLLHLSDEDVASCLLPIKGIGQWTVDMFLIFTLKRPDVLPLADLAIQKGFAKLLARRGASSDGTKKGKNATVVGPSAKKTKGGSKIIAFDDMERLAEPFRPYRSLATWYIWKSFGD